MSTNISVEVLLNGWLWTYCPAASATWRGVSPANVTSDCLNWLTSPAMSLSICPRSWSPVSR
jgi:hypothetical protein